jgi:glutathione synthase/RimK-type ligase-like ATP-grasp enzyme
MILLITNKEDITADFIVLELKKRKKEFIRFNTEDYPEKVNVEILFKKGKISGQFKFLNSNRIVPFSNIKSAWYRRPTFPVFSSVEPKYRKYCIQEAITVLSGIWNTLDTFWVSNPHNILFAENKIVQLMVASQIGFSIPSTVITNDCKIINEFYNHNKGSVIIKPVKTGMLNDKLIVFTSAVKKDVLSSIKQAVPLPSIYQNNIKKKLDIRITVIGKRVFATEIHSQANKSSTVDWRKSQDINLIHKKHNIPRSLINMCIIMLEKMGLQFGAIDMILDNSGKYYFLEINPNGQWGWIEKRTGHKLTEALADLLIEGREKHENI